MTTARMKPVLLVILAALLSGVLMTSVSAKDPKAGAPESVGLSTERLERLGKAMQDDIDQKKPAASSSSSRATAPSPITKPSAWRISNPGRKCRPTTFSGFTR